MEKRYSDKDLIRKPITRQIILLFSLFLIINGLRHWDIVKTGGLLWGIINLVMLHFAYERLLKEK